MADGKHTKTTDDGSYNQQEIKELIKSGRAFRFVGEEISKAYESPEGDYYVEAIASSDQEDLVGDIMSQKALKAMEVGFVGKTVFMNHRTSVPDDVFGSVVSASIEKQNGVQLLIFTIVVEKENKSAMKTWKIINGGRVKLGTSVTVLVLSSKPNPARKFGIIIDDVESIEHSIVGVPCNRESQTIAATASKALKLANLSSEEDETMKSAIKSGEGQEAAAATAAPAPETPAPVEAAAPAPVTDPPPAEAPAAAGDAAVVEEAAAVAPEAEAPKEEAAAEPAAEEKGFMHRTKAAAARFASMVAEVTTSKVAKTTDEIGTLKTKGLFADMVAHPTFWDLIDILFEVRWALKCQIWNLQYAGETDFSEHEAAWSECLDEFKASALDSFIFWDINEGKDTDAVGSASMSLEEAQQIEGTFKQLADLIETADEPAKADELRGIGKSLLEVAEKAGVDFTPERPVVDVEIDVTKTKEFGEMEARAIAAEAKVKDLEAQLDQANEDLEVTKAGLAAAVEATNATLRQPLPVERPKN